MGNIFLTKNPTHEFNDPDLNKNLLLDDLIERLTYLEDTVNNLDAKIWQVEANSTANLKVLSADVHHLHSKIKK